MGKRMAIMRVSTEIVENLLPPGKTVDLVADKLGPVDYGWLERAMLLPPGAKIDCVTAAAFFAHGQIGIRVESPDFVETLEGNQMPEVYCLYERGSDGKPVFAGWSGPAVEHGGEQ